MAKYQDIISWIKYGHNKLPQSFSIPPRYLLNALRSPKNENIQEYLYLFNQLYNNKEINYNMEHKDLSRTLKDINLNAKHTSGQTIFTPVYNNPKLSQQDKYIIDYIKKRYNLSSRELNLILKNPSLLDKFKEELSVETNLKGRTKKKKTTPNNPNTKTPNKQRIKIKDVKEKLLNYHLCNNCPLKDQTQMVPLDSNAEYMDEVEILIIGEAPADSEVKEGKPFVGKSGKLIRKILDYKNLQKKWLIINACHCYHKPGNIPTKEELQNCLIRNKYIINMLINVKKVVFLGKTSLSLINKSNISITKLLQQQVIKDRLYPIKNLNIQSLFKTNPAIYILPHPSYFVRKGNGKYFTFLFGQIFNLLIKKASSSPKRSSSLYHKEFNRLFDIIQYMNETYGEENYRLVDVQEYKEKYEKNGKEHTVLDKLLFIFRTRNKEKIVLAIKDPKIEFYTSPISNDEIVKPIESLQKHIISVKERYNFSKTFQGTIYQLDRDIASFYTEKYYQYRQNEPENINLKTFIFDIENYATTEHPINPRDQEDEIICLTAYDNYSNKFYYLYSKQWKPDLSESMVIKKTKELYDIHNLEIIGYKNEKELLKGFFSFLETIDPDLITNWNVWYDIDSMVSRYKNVFGEFPKFKGKSIEIDPNGYKTRIETIAILDYQSAYKRTKLKKQESYALDFIAKIELDEGKHTYSGSLTQFAKNNPILFAVYNIRDVDIVLKLDKHLNLIGVANTLKRVANSTWESAREFIGIRLIDPLILSRANSIGLAIRDVDKNAENQKFEGAFVYKGDELLPEWVVNFDLASLYPHILARYNLGPETFKLKILDEQIAFDIIHNKEKLDLSKSAKVLINPTTSDKKEVTMTVKELLKYINTYKLIPTITGVCLLPHKAKRSIMYTIMNELYSGRVKYKKMKNQEQDKELKLLYDLYQHTYKILMNAIYGVQGNSYFRLFMVDIARTVTLSAQEVNRFCSYHVSEYVDKMSSVDSGKPNIPISSKFMEDIKLQNIMYMDTDSMYVKLSKFIPQSTSVSEGLILLKQISQPILDYIHTDLINILLQRHNIDPSDKIFNFNYKIEAYIRKMYIPVKKQYAYWMIGDENGNQVDKIVFKGLAVVKSDFPKFTRTILGNMIEKILKEDISKESIIQWVYDSYNEYNKLLDEGNHDAAKPMSISKNLDSYKSTTPVQVKGAYIWNELVYNHYTSPEKGYLWYINGVKVSGLKRISSRIKNETDYYEAEDRIIDNLRKRGVKTQHAVEVVLVPMESIGSEPKLDKFPVDAFIIDKERMIINFFLKQVTKLTDSFEIDVFKLLNKKRPYSIKKPEYDQKRELLLFDMNKLKRE